MTFNKCSIAGQNYGEVIDKVTGEVIDDANKVGTYLSYMLWLFISFDNLVDRHKRFLLLNNFKFWIFHT